MRLVRLQNAMMVLCAVLVSAYGASMYASLHRAYHQTLYDATGTIESIARSSEVGTNRAIFGIDAALLGVERMLETLLPDTPLDDRQVKALLAQFNDQTLVVRDILILDTSGRLLNKATWAAGPHQDFSKEPFFTAHQAGGLPSLFIGRPGRSRATGGWSVMMSRPLLRRDEVIGVIAAEVPITVFSDFYNSVVANSGVKVQLLLDDDTLIATEPHREEQIGHRLDDAGPVLAAAAVRRFGVIGNLETDSAMRNVIAFARIPARPLLLVASRGRGDILRQWRGERVGSVVAFILFAVTAGCLTWLMVRALERQEKAAAKLRGSEERLQRQSDLLQSTLENMGEGLSVFDRRGGRSVRAPRALLPRSALCPRAADRARPDAPHPAPRDARRGGRLAIFGYHRAQGGRRQDGAGLGPGRTRQPLEGRLPRQYEPRAAHAFECDHRLLGDPERRAFGAVEQYPLSRICQRHPLKRSAPPVDHQRRARHVQDRGRQASDP